MPTQPRRWLAWVPVLGLVVQVVRVLRGIRRLEDPALRPRGIDPWEYVKAAQGQLATATVITAALHRRPGPPRPVTMIEGREGFYEVELTAVQSPAQCAGRLADPRSVSPGVATPRAGAGAGDAAHACRRWRTAMSALRADVVTA